MREEWRMRRKEGRKVGPSNRGREEGVQNRSGAGLLVAAMASGRVDVLDTATDDRLHQPAGSKMFPAMYAIFEAAKVAGAHCAYLSGGGSTLCALATTNQRGIADAMLVAARAREVEGKPRVTRPVLRGAEVVG